MTVLSTANRVCKIRIQNPPDRDGFTPTSDDWKDFTSVYAAVIPLAGQETYVDPGYQALVTHRMEAAFVKGVKPSMRVKYAGRFFHIQSVINADERSIDMILLCTELV